LFISWDPSADNEEIHKAVCDALQVNSVQTDELIPLDWMENNCPSRWLLNGEILEIDWFGQEAYDIIEKR
jgi:alpha-galactosidase